jgi:hypothetical protein
VYYPPTETPEAYQTPLPVPEIERLTRTKIPETAFNIQTHLIWTGAVYVKFSLPADDLRQFLLDAEFEDVHNGFWPFGDRPSIPWWPKSDTFDRDAFDNVSEDSFAGGGVALPDFGKNIGIDMRDKAIYIIYLECFDT